MTCGLVVLPAVPVSGRHTHPAAAHQGPGFYLEPEGWLTCHQHILIFHVSCSEATFSLSVFLPAFGVLSCDMWQEEPRYSVTALSGRRSQKQKNWCEWNSFVVHRGGMSTKKLFIPSLTISASPQEQSLVEPLCQQALHTSSGSFSQGFWENSQGFWEDSNRTLLSLNTPSCR